MENKIIWSIRPSFWLYSVRIFFIFVLIGSYWFIGRSIIPGEYVGLSDVIMFSLGFLISAVIFLEYVTTIYELHDTRLVVKQGILVQHREEIELYRVKDYVLIKPLLIRILGLSHLLLHTSDYTTPNLKLFGIYEGDKKLNEIREIVEKMREEKGVFEVD